MIEIRHTDKATLALRQAYDDLYRRSTTEHWRSYYRWILKRLAPRPGSQLLDVCCGTAKLAEEAQALGLRAIGTDFSRVALRHAQVAVSVSDAEQLPFAADTFDYVINLGSLEHLIDIDQGVREMARVMRPDGICCVLVPNLFGLLWTVRAARHTGELEDDGQPLQRYATLQQWRRLLEAGGLRVDRIIGYELPPPATVAQWLEYIRDPWFKLLPLAVWPFVPVNIASMLVFFCHKTRFLTT